MAETKLSPEMQAHFHKQVVETAGRMITFVGSRDLRRMLKGNLPVREEDRMHFTCLNSNEITAAAQAEVVRRSKLPLIRRMRGQWRDAA